MTPAFTRSSPSGAGLPEAAVFESDDLDRRWQEPATRAAAGGGGWRNPPYELRVGLVAAAWAVPGVLFGLMASLFTASACDPATAAVAGGVAFAAAGGWQEALW